MSPADDPRQRPADWIKLALAGTGVAVVVADGRGDVMFMSSDAAALTGWSQDGAAGRPLAAVFRTAAEHDGRAVLIARDGSEVRIAHGTDAIRDESGTVVGAVLVFRRASEPRPVARALEEARAFATALGRMTGDPLASHDADRRMRDRAAELARANELLTAEIARRERSEASRRELQNRLTTAQEDERRRIARELHDQLGQHLTGLGLGLKVVKDTTPNPSPAWTRLHELQALTERIGREVHQLALELRPTALDDFGLEAALANYTDEWAVRAGVEVDFHAAGLDAGRLPAATETALYRVILEALANVLKHARARRVSVVLQASLTHVVAIVEDDGCGFDPAPALTGSSTEHRLGVLGMRERVALLGGELTIDSEPERGTTVIARVPLGTTTEEVRDG